MKSTTPTLTHATASQQSADSPCFHKQGVEEASPDFTAGGAMGVAVPQAPVFHKSPGIQTKLTIGQPGDKYEQEADQMAEQVVQRSAINYPYAGEGGMPPPVQTKCAECEKEEPTETPGLQTKSESGTATASPSLASRLSSRKGGGNPLPAGTRTGMEHAFGADFSGVRVHTDRSAIEMNQELGAQAFTHESDIYFGAGKYDAGSSGGKKLLAHELTHTVQQGAARTQNQAITPTQPQIQGGWLGDAWDWATDTASDIGSGIASGVSAVGSAIGSGISAVGGALGSAWNTATQFLGSAASWVWDGLLSLGSTFRNWLSTAAGHVWAAIRWFGSKAWEAIKWMGIFLWEKLALLGTNVWSFLSNIPVRFWRILVHGWEGITGILSWAWSGLRGAAGHVWDGVVGVYRWLEEGVEGAVGWLMGGIQSGFSWAIDFIQNPSWSKLWEGMTGSLSWAWEGLRGFAQWGWNGVVGAAQWVWAGMRGFGIWLYDGIVGGLERAGRMLLYVLELMGLGEALQIIWGLIFRMRKLTPDEINASKMVHPPGMIPYDMIRVDENSLISMIGGAAVTTFHVIHTPKGGIPISTMVHELTHVAQYEHVGAVYMPEAIHAQVKYGRTGGRGSGSAYDYEREGSLTDLRAAGKKFKDFNRESQAEIVEDYYKCLTDTPPNPCLDMVPFINDMQRGEF